MTKNPFSGREPAGEVSSANPRATALIRAARGATGRDLGELPLPDAVRGAVAACLRGEDSALPLDLSKAVGMEIDGKPRKLLPRIVPFARRDGTGRGAVLVFSDVTELARLDEMRMKLAAVASHELRTPLTTIRMTLLMLEARAARLEERDRELVATALVGVEQLAVTVAEFLDLTRIEAGQLRLHWDVIDVRRLVSQAIGTINARAEEARDLSSGGCRRSLSARAARRRGMSMPTTSHTSRDFETELQQLRAQALAMGEHCKRIVRLAFNTFWEGEPSLGVEVPQLEAQLDQDEIDVHALSLRIIALRQPVAVDLRFLAAALRLVTDLERIGDEAVNISKRAVEGPDNAKLIVGGELSGWTTRCKRCFRPRCSP